MVTDLVVVVPGIMGSCLADSAGHEIWAPSRQGITRAIKTFGGSIRELTLPSDLGGDPAPDNVKATRLMPAFHALPGVWTPTHGYDSLVAFLRQPRFELMEDTGANGAPPGNLILFAYDWRLSNRLTATLLKRRVESALLRWQQSSPDRSDAQVVFICHSMGGLVVRWYLDKEGGAAITRAVVTLGTPHRGAVKSLAELVNGVRKGVGPLKVDVTAFARSCPSVYQLLPEYACITAAGGRLLKTTEVDLAPLDAAAVAKGMAFHDDLDAAATGAYQLLSLVGIGQPTSTTAKIGAGAVEPLPTIDGREPGGDGTVPRLAARPKGVAERDAAVRGVGDGHGALVLNAGALDQLAFLLTADDITYRAEDTVDPQSDEVPGISVPDVHEEGDEIRGEIHASDVTDLEVVVLDEGGTERVSCSVEWQGATDDTGRSIGVASCGAFEAGGYTLELRERHSLDRQPAVRATTLVWDA